MGKRNLVWVFAITIILSTVGYIYVNSDKKNKELHILSGADIKKNGEPVNIAPFAKAQIQTAEDIHDGGTNVDSIKFCINFSEIENQINSEMYEEFLRNNTLSLWTVNDYLREMSNDDLELEFKSGSAEAAFVLGMNLMYSSYNTNTIHPDIARGERQEKSNKIKKLDSKQLSAGREWLWKAALNGIGIALAEIGGSYQLESQLIEQKSKLEHENIIFLKTKLAAQELSFQILYQMVNPSIVELQKIDSSYINEKFVNHEYDEKEKILKALKEKWKLDREAIGKSYEINLKVSEDIRKIMNTEQINCP